MLQEKNESVLKHDLLDLVYPVGSIYMSVNNVNPGTLFGGTWEQLKDRFLLAAGDTYNNAATGGSATMAHTHKVTAAGTNVGTALTIAQMPVHGHEIFVWDNAGTTGNAWYYAGATKTTHNGARLYNDNASSWKAAGASALAAHGGMGDPSGTTDLRGSGSTHTHTFNGTEVTSGVASNTDNMPPYLAVCMWKRTA